MAPAEGYAAHTGIGAADPVDKPLDFKADGLQMKGAHNWRGGIRGTRSHDIARTRAGMRRVEGPITGCPTAVELSYLLQWILGGTPSGTSYPLAESLISKFVTVDRVAKVHKYSGCVVNKATFKSSQGEALELTLDLLGVDETIAAAGSFPNLTLDTTTPTFEWYECALTIAASTVLFREATLVIDNKLDAERFLNSQTRTAIPAQDREITIALNVPYGDYPTLYDLGTAGAAVVLTFTSGATSLAFTMPKVTFPPESPLVPGKQEIMLPLNGMAYSNGATPELSTVLDSTP